MKSGLSGAQAFGLVRQLHPAGSLRASMRQRQSRISDKIKFPASQPPKSRISPPSRMQLLSGITPYAQRTSFGRVTKPGLTWCHSR